MLDQRDVVQAAVLADAGVKSPPAHWPRRTFEMDGPAAVRGGEIATTIPGAYWRVLSVMLIGERVRVVLDPLKPTSIEAHGQVVQLPAGRLV